jgi:hypothetical protein
MGCDYFYKGSLKDHRLQEKVVELVAQFWSDGMWIYPEPETRYPTRKEADLHTAEDGLYPFNFFGFIPFPDSDSLEFGQMVFDRTDGGRLVTLSKLPAGHEIEGTDSGENCYRDVEFCLKPKGYLRGWASYRVGLLFCVIKKRYFQDLWVGDDHDVCKETEHLVDRLRIADRIMDENLTFDDCYALFEAAHEKYRAKKARFKGAHERMTRMEEARRRRLEGEGEEQGKLTPPNPIRSLASIYREAAAKLEAERTSDEIRNGDGLQEDKKSARNMLEKANDPSL